MVMAGKWWRKAEMVEDWQPWPLPPSPHTLWPRCCPLTPSCFMAAAPFKAEQFSSRRPHTLVRGRGGLMILGPEGRCRAVGEHCLKKAAL